MCVLNEYHILLLFSIEHFPNMNILEINREEKMEKLVYAESFVVLLYIIGKWAIVNL